MGVFPFLKFYKLHQIVQSNTNWTKWLSFVYKTSGCGFESRCPSLKIRCNIWVDWKGRISYHESITFTFRNKKASRTEPSREISEFSWSTGTWCTIRFGLYINASDLHSKKLIINAFRLASEKPKEDDIIVLILQLGYRN